MDYISSQFNVQLLPAYKLLVHVGQKTDKLTVVDQQHTLYAYLEYDAIHPAVKATQLLSLPFPHVRIILPLEQFTFVPQEVFEEAHLDLYKQAMDNTLETPVFFQPLEDLGLVVVFQYNPLLYKKWQSVFAQASIQPDLATVLSRAKQHASKQGITLGIYTNHFKTGIFLFKHGQFQFYNTFAVQTIDDLNYYILNVMQSFEIRDTMPIILLLGDPLSAGHIARLKHYSNQVVTLETAVEIKAYIELIHIRKQVVLFDSLLCE